MTACGVAMLEDPKQAAAQALWGLWGPQPTLGRLLTVAQVMVGFRDGFVVDGKVLHEIRPSRERVQARSGVSLFPSYRARVFKVLLL